MSKRVLAVGNCSSDHARLRRVLALQFGAEVVRASAEEDTLEWLQREPFALVLVNRKLRGDGGAGVELIRRIKADPRLAATAVMLLSEYPLHQATAVDAGAEPGLGKSQLAEAAGRERLAPFLREHAPSEESHSR